MPFTPSDFVIKLSFMIDLADLRFINAVASAKSLAAAARALDVTPPAVSQRLAQLEAKLRLKLVERGTGLIRLTAEGEMMAMRSEALLQGVVELEGDLAERRGAMCGPLQVVAPFGYGRLHVAPIIASFVSDNPEVNPTLVLTDDPRGAMRSGAWDVLVHVGRMPDLDIVQRKIATNRRLLCAAPAYLNTHGTPASPQDLHRHRCGVIRENQADVTLWSLAGPEKGKASIRITPAFTSNDGEVIRGWALEGLGIVERSEWSIAEDVAAGRLLQVLPDWSLTDADIVILLNPRAVRAKRIEAFVQHMIASNAEKPF